jgi:hypothetical protein
VFLHGGVGGIFVYDAIVDVLEDLAGVGNAGFIDETSVLSIE